MKFSIGLLLGLFAMLNYGLGYCGLRYIADKLGSSTDPGAVLPFIALIFTWALLPIVTICTFGSMYEAKGPKEPDDQLS